MHAQKNVYAELGEVIAGLKRPREKRYEMTIFVSKDLAVQDAVTAKIAYDKAVKKGRGRFLKIVVASLMNGNSFVRIAEEL
jgi:ornithine cyclodeaminase/alanine dehydrogenase-like protein (mu-crystallin family)